MEVTVEDVAGIREVDKCEVGSPGRLFLEIKEIFNLGKHVHHDINSRIIRQIHSKTMTRQTATINLLRTAILNY